MSLILQKTFPPGPKRRYPGEFLLKLMQNPLGFLSELNATHGPVVGMKLGKRRIVTVQQPELIHQVLVTDAASYIKGRGLEVAKRLLGEGLLTSEGQLHKQQRQLLQSVFQARKVEQFAPTVQACSERLLGGWPEQGVISASPEMTRLTLQIVGESLFGSNLENDVAEVRSAMDEVVEVFRVCSLPFYELGEKLFPPLKRRPQQVRARLDAVVGRMISEHRACPHQDLLGRMVEACESSKIDDNLLRDEAMTLFLAGHETTAHALTFALYLLSRHPAEQESARQELLEVIGDGRVEARHIEQLPFLKAVLLETLRLYPTAWMIGRRSTRETDLGEYSFPADCTVLMSPYVVHRDPTNFPEPERFWPLRWQLRPRGSLPKLCYFPFGGGPRVCIGEHFAWQEMMLGLGTILQTYRLGLCPVEHPKLRTGITLAPGEPLPIPVERLSGASKGLPRADRQGARPGGDVPPEAVWSTV